MEEQPTVESWYETDEGDVVAISVDPIGTLENPVA